MTDAPDWPALAEVKDQLRIRESDTTDDRIILACRDAATAHVLERCGQPDWGDGDVPPDVRRAAVMLAGRLVKRRDSLDGSIGMPDLGTVRIYGRDFDIERLLVPHLDLPAS